MKRIKNPFLGVSSILKSLNSLNQHPGSFCTKGKNMKKTTYAQQKNGNIFFVSELNLSMSDTGIWECVLVSNEGNIAQNLKEYVFIKPIRASTV